MAISIPPTESSFRIPFDGMWHYLNFAGEMLIDIVLTSFKEA